MHPLDLELYVSKYVINRLLVLFVLLINIPSIVVLFIVILVVVLEGVDLLVLRIVLPILVVLLQVLMCEWNLLPCEVDLNRTLVQSTYGWTISLVCQ